MVKLKLTIKRLYRSKKERMVAGICGGISDYYGIDPSLVRVLWATLTILTAIFPGILIYIIAWIIIPEER